MKRIAHLILAMFLTVPVFADVIQGGGGGLSRALANALYCQLAGCTMTGALTASSSGVVFNGSVVKAGGANILNIGNGTNAQSFRVYNTDDGAGNAEYGTFDFATSANVLTIGTVKTGTGTLRGLTLNAGASVLKFQFAGATQLELISANLYPTNSTALVLGGASNLFKSIYLSNSIQGATQKTLTESSATGFVRVDITSGSSVGGSVEYTVEANDATDYQSRSGRVAFQIVNKAGTETCVISGFDGTAAPSETKDGSSLARSDGASTLTYAFTADTTPTNGCNLQLNAVSSLTQTTLRIDYRVNVTSGSATVTGL